MIATQTQFDERNPRYYTCSCCHVRTGVIVISSIKIVILALATISAVFMPVHDETMRNVQRSVPMCAIIIVVCAVLAIVGMRENKPAFLIPQIVMQVISLVVLVVYSILLCIFLGPAVIIIILFSLGLVFAVWFLVVFVRGYIYLKEKREFVVNNQSCFVAGSDPMTGYNPTIYAEGQQPPGQPNYAQFGYAKVP